MKRKVLYNITIAVDEEVHEEWKEWMIRQHIPDMMSTGCFSEYKMSMILGNEGNDSLNYAIQYVSPSIEKFFQYRDEHSKRLINDQQTRYKDRYASFRTLMEIHDEG